MKNVIIISTVAASVNSSKVMKLPEPLPEYAANASEPHQY